MIEIEMNLFGAFRKFQTNKTPVLLTVDSPASLNQIKSALSKKLTEISVDFKENGEKLILDSAIANESEILLPSVVLTQSCKLSILPPVCGG